MATATVYRTATEEGTKTTRAQRGLALYRERGGEIVVYLDGTYGVPSRTIEGGFYHVDLEAEDAHERCGCPDAKHRGYTCLHQVFVEAHLAASRREMTRKAATPAPRPRKRCSAPPMAERRKMARDFLARMGGA